MCFIVIFQKLTQKRSMIFNRFGATSQGHYFSTIHHGNLFIHYFNEESKGTAKFISGNKKKKSVKKTTSVLKEAK